MPPPPLPPATTYFWGETPEEEFYKSQGVKNSKLYYETPNGKLFTQSWTPLEQNAPIKGVVFMTHGYGSDTSWCFQKICMEYTKWGYAVFAADLLGHGRSDGLHGYLGDMDKVAATSLTYFLSVRKSETYCKLPAFLFGESMGGMITMLMYFQSEPDTWTGLIFSAPLFVIPENMVPSKLHLTMYGLLFGYADTWAAMPDNKMVGKAIRDPEKLKVILVNPKRYTGKPRVGTMREVMLYEKASSEDKSLKLYDGMYHSLVQGEPDDAASLVLADMKAWIDERLPYVKSYAPFTSSPFGSFADAVKDIKNVPPRSSPVSCSPALVLDDTCVNVLDVSRQVMGRTKDVNSISNIRTILTNEGFVDVKLSYLGGLWVMIELNCGETKMKLLQHIGIPLHLWSSSTFSRIGMKWGTVMDIEESPGSSFARKRLCIKTSMAVNILETFKVIYKGKIFMVRAKELFTWSPCFLEYKDPGYLLEDESSLDGNNNLGPQAPRIDVHEVNEKANSHHSDDPFGLYDLLRKSTNLFASKEDPSLSHPPGFTLVASHQDHIHSNSAHLEVHQDEPPIAKGSSSKSYRELFFSGGARKISNKSSGYKEKQMEAFLDHFTTRFKQPSGGRLKLNMSFPSRLSSDQVGDLDKDISIDEIRKAVWDCGSNSSFIALIPKVMDAKFVTDFRPISLIGSVYKMVTKILANRLTTVISGLISNTQSAFVANRHILDGLFILNEVLAWCKRRRKQALVFKVDFAKAYDSVRWDFLLDVLIAFGFGPKWCQWIRGIFSSNMASILINGSPSSEFPIFSGLKQCDPLAPFLFILVMESLHLSVTRAVNDGIFKGLHITGSSSLSHLFYADDAVFIEEWSIENLDNLLKILNYFHLASGLCINVNKSHVLGVGVPLDIVRQGVLRIGCEVMQTLFKYLGVMVGDHMSRYLAWSNTIQKVRSRLSRWKVKTLSIGGRLTLLKSVLGAVPIYNMSLYKALKCVLHELQRLRNNFFKGGDSQDSKIPWVAWAKVLSSKKNGGLGVSSFFALNRALLLKWVWRYLVQDGSLWYHIISAVYGSQLECNFVISMATVHIGLKIFVPS
nr:caffeoylshikimate esterase-like [Tanacetum cinerariifolium]